MIVIYNEDDIACRLFVSGSDWPDSGSDSGLEIKPGRSVFSDPDRIIPVSGSGTEP